MSITVSSSSPLGSTVESSEITWPLANTGAATTTDAVTSKVTGDAASRFVVNSGGNLEWGDGTAAVDTNLYRFGANILATDDTLYAGAASGASTMKIGAAGPASEAGIAFSFTGSFDTNLYRSAANVLKTDDTLHVGTDAYIRQGATTQVGLGAVGPSGQAGVTFNSVTDSTTSIYRAGPSQINVTGEVVFANTIYVSSTADVNLYRAAANVLGTDDSFKINGSTSRIQFGHADHAQTTVGAAGGASAPPATPTKYFKVKDSGGTEYVIPAYAAA